MHYPADCATCAALETIHVKKTEGERSCGSNKIFNRKSYELRKFSGNRFSAREWNDQILADSHIGYYMFDIQSYINFMNSTAQSLAARAERWAVGSGNGGDNVIGAGNGNDSGLQGQNTNEGGSGSSGRRSGGPDNGKGASGQDDVSTA